MAKTSINVRACNIGSAERHNLRSKELDYIRPELSYRNEQWSEMKIADVLEDIREKYRQHTGQSMQKKATPIREGVVVIEDGTTLRQLQDFAERIEERFGIHTFQIYTHKDEGASVWNGNAEAWKPNYHAHMIFDWTDGETGRTRKLNKQDMAEMQTMLAECLGMERGISSDRKHLSAIQYKNMAEAEKAAQIEKECRQMEHERNTIADELEQAGKKLEDVQEKLKDATSEIKVQKLKGAAADTGTALLKAGTTVIDATASLFNSGKVKRKYSINSLVYWVTYVHNVVYSFYRSMIYCYINSTQRCAGSIVIDIIPTNGADKRKFFPFAPYFPVTNVIKRYFYPYFPAIIGIKGYSFPYFPYLSGIMKIKTALYSLFSRLDWHKTVVFPCLGEIYEGIRSLSWEIPVT